MSFLKGPYGYSDFPPSATIGELCELWKSYFSAKDLNIWKFKFHNWAIPHDDKNPYFSKSTTLQEYVNFYTWYPGENKFVIFV